METLTATNIQTVQEIYAAFGRGDIEFIVARLDENVNWQIMGAPGVRYAAIYKGQTEVPSFFQKLNASIEMKEFEPQHFFEKNNKVGVFGRFKATERETGKEVETDWAMLWEFNDDGKVVNFKDYYDTFNVAMAENK
jgi:ketosteroid isomerase-like protein